MSLGGEEKEVLKLGKGGMDDPPGGLRLPGPHRSFFFQCILLKFGSVFEPSPEALVAAI